MKKLLIVIIFLSTVLSCSNDDDTSRVNIRLSNVSEFNFENVVINASTENTNVNLEFELLSSGNITEYKSFKTARISPFIELQIEGEIYTLIPLTTGQDDSLSPGNYTYQINATNSQEQFERLSMILITE